MPHNRTKTFILLAVLTALMLWAGSVFGGTFGLIIAGVFVVLLNFASYFWSDKIVLMMYKAQEVKQKEHPELYNLVKEVAHLAGLPMPKVYIIPSQQANAFATGRNPKHAAVAVTAGIMQLLSKDELKGVIAHEMSHVKNRDVLIQTVAAMIAGVIGSIAAIARWSAIFGFGGDRDDGGGFLELIVLAIVTPIAAMLIQFAISRSREYMADESAAKMLHSGRSLADALAKIEHSTKHVPMEFGSPNTSSLFIANPFKGGFFVNILSTHPPTEKRIAKLKTF